MHIECRSIRRTRKMLVLNPSRLYIKPKIKLYTTKFRKIGHWTQIASYFLHGRRIQRLSCVSTLLHRRFTKAEWNDLYYAHFRKIRIVISVKYFGGRRVKHRFCIVTITSLFVTTYMFLFYREFLRKPEKRNATEVNEASEVILSTKKLFLRLLLIEIFQLYVK